jgi:hypothetical protein
MRLKIPRATQTGTNALIARTVTPMALLITLIDIGRCLAAQ